MPHLKRFSVILFFVLASHNSVFGLQTTGDDRSPMDCMSSLNQSLYMSSLSCMLKQDDGGQGSKKYPFFDQYLSTMMSFVGDEIESRKVFYRNQPFRPQPDLTTLEDHQLVNAKEEILRQTKDRQIVLINEAHHVPETRLLTLQLLRPMYAAGFRYLAAESFTAEFVAEAEKLRFPTQRLGYYVAEPTFGLIVREALKIGFKLIPYESSPDCDPFNSPPEECQNLRERGQALNIYNEIFAKEPSAKVLVHAGYQHVDKKGGGFQPSWIPMGRYLWELTNIEPFSIDQASYFENGMGDLSSDLYKKVAERFDFTESIALIHQRTSVPFVEKDLIGHYDMQIFLPRQRQDSGRPAWRASMPGIARVDFKDLHCRPKSKCLLQAVLKNELTHSFIPVDQVLVEDTHASLYLTPGTYEVRVLDERDQILSKREISVP